MGILVVIVDKHFTHFDNLLSVIINEVGIKDFYVLYDQLLEKSFPLFLQLVDALEHRRENRVSSLDMTQFGHDPAEILRIPKAIFEIPLS